MPETLEEIETAWEEPEHLLDRDDLYGSDKKYGCGPSFTIFFRPEWSTFFGPQWREEQEDDRDIQLLRGLYGKSGQLVTVAKLIVNGYGNRQVSRLTGASKTTVKKYREILEKLTGKVFLCACGQLATHQGWCYFRFQGSEKRQEFMKRWHRRTDIYNVGR